MQNLRRYMASDDWALLPLPTAAEHSLVGTEKDADPLNE
jgi:hypothetical protein